MNDFYQIDDKEILECQEQLVPSVKELVEKYQNAAPTMAVIYIAACMAEEIGLSLQEVINHMSGMMEEHRDFIDSQLTPINDAKEEMN